MPPTLTASSSAADYLLDDLDFEDASSAGGRHTQPPTDSVLVDIGVGIVRTVMDRLNENAEEVREDGGNALTHSARLALARAAAAIVTSALLNPHYSVEEFDLTPFARSNGGAYLLVDLHKTEKRLTLSISPDAQTAAVVLTAAHGTSRTFPISAGDWMGRHMAWLTRAE